MTITHVITGVGHSGTQWSARMLTSLGLETRHETYCSGWTDTYGDNGLWREAEGVVGESSWQAVPFLPAMREEGTVTVLQVRYPTLVAQSLAHRGLLDDPDRPMVGFINAHLPTPLDPAAAPADRALDFWIRWNTLALPHADLVWMLPPPVRSVYGLLDRVQAHPDRLPHPRSDEVAAAVTSPATNKHRDTSAPALPITPDLLKEAMNLFGLLLARSRFVL